MQITTIEQLKKWRRHIHQNPELSLKEFETAKFIRDELSKLNISYEVAMDTGTIVFIDAGSKHSILLRADIDALPITEENNIDFKSKNNGVMHACGHDAHATMLLGAVNELNELIKDDKLSVNIVAVFQPSEESFGGANMLVKKYDFSKFNILGAYALHINPDYPEGNLITREGPIMASCNEFEVNIKGKSAHVGIREEGINALNAAVSVYQQIQSIPTYDLDSKHTNIIHTGLLNAGEVMNSVPSKSLMQGTIRTYNMNDLEISKKRMKEICNGVSISSRCDINLKFNDGYPPLLNSASLLNRVELATKNAGINFILKDEPYLLGEDFSFYDTIAPINYSFIGIRNEELGYTSGLHTPTLQMREEALVFGVDYFVQIALSYN